MSGRTVWSQMSRILPLFLMRPAVPCSGGYESLGGEGVGGPVIPDGFAEQRFVQSGDHVRAVAVVVDRFQVQVCEGHFLNLLSSYSVR